jgi:GTP cyclohydrolase II
VYATGHEGRGIGLIDKLRAYMEQDEGADTVDANLRLGLPADNRRYDDAAAVLRAVGVRSVRR